jgi:dihydrolipoamide dehydrogenase
MEDHGIVVKDPSLDLGRMMKRKDEVVGRLVQGVSFLLKKNGVDWIRATGTLQDLRGDVKSIEVHEEAGGKRRLETRRVLIATGSGPAELPGLPFDGKDIVSSTEALSFREVPKRLLVVGAGAIGLELGSVWSRLGSDVTVVEMMPEIIPGWDAKLAGSLRKILKIQGITFILEARVTGVQRKKGVLEARVEAGKTGRREIYSADKILVAVGRRPDHARAGILDAGITLDERGYVRADDNFMTNLPGVFAIGDVIGGAMLAHKAEDEGIVCVERMSGIPAHMRYDIVPNVIYTAPEVASVGATEEQLRAEGAAYRTGTFSFKANGRAIALGETEGFVKILADAASDEILGVHILGPRASALIAEPVAFMEFGGSAEDVARTVHAHPTLSEAVREAAFSVDGRAIHAVSS